MQRWQRHGSLVGKLRCPVRLGRLRQVHHLRTNVQLPPPSVLAKGTSMSIPDLWTLHPRQQLDLHRSGPREFSGRIITSMLEPRIKTLSRQEISGTRKESSSSTTTPTFPRQRRWWRGRECPGIWAGMCGIVAANFIVAHTLIEGPEPSFFFNSIRLVSWEVLLLTTSLPHGLKFSFFLFWLFFCWKGVQR